MGGPGGTCAESGEGGGRGAGIAGRREMNTLIFYSWAASRSPLVLLLIGHDVNVTQGRCVVTSPGDATSGESGGQLEGQGRGLGKGRTNR